MTVQIAIPFRGFGLTSSTLTDVPSSIDTSDIVEVPGEIEIPTPSWEVEFVKEFTVNLNDSSDTLPTIKSSKWGKLAIPSRPFKRIIRIDTHIRIILDPAKYKLTETSYAVFAYTSVPTITLYKVNNTILNNPVTSVIPLEIDAPRSLSPSGVPYYVLSDYILEAAAGTDIIEKNEQSKYYVGIDFSPIEWDNDIHPDYSISAATPWTLNMTIEGTLYATVIGTSDIPD